jgi:catechol 2,3-dioxygenase-like lactoylglutathione lyase family enzyme
MDWRLELIVVPVSDLDRAKSFYSEGVGFNLDVDVSPGGEFRVIQLTPPGSHCSIVLLRQPERAGAVQGLHLVVADIEAARNELSGRSIEVSDFYHFESGQQVGGLDPSRSKYSTFCSFIDPDGNGWLLQEVNNT